MRLPLPLVVSAAVLATASPATAANYFWNPGTASGSWVSNPNWSTPGNGPIYSTTWADGNTANFTAAGQSITLNGDVSAAGINFTASGILIQPTTGSLSLPAGSVSVSGASSTTATIAAVIGDGSGTTVLTKTGIGVLALLGTHTYTGGTSITQGTLRLGNGSSNGSITGDVVNNATFQFNNPSAGTFAGNIAGVGSLSVVGAGPQTFTGNNTYSGTTLLTGAAKVYVAAGGRLASAPAGTVTASTATTLGGEGTIGGSVVTFQSGSTLDVGNGATANDIGTLTLSNDLSFNAGATTTFHLSRAGGSTAGVGYDRLDVGGAITLGGSFTAVVADNTGSNPFGTITVLSGASRTGTFSNLAGGDFVPGMAGFAGFPQWQIDYTATGVNLVPVPEPGLGLGVAAGLGLAWWGRRTRRSEHTRSPGASSRPTSQLAEPGPAPAPAA